MPGNPNNTQKIEILERQAANTVARLDVHNTQLKGMLERLEKGVRTTEGHADKLATVEQRLQICVNVREYLSEIASVRSELVAVKKDIESLSKWKEDVKKEKDEASPACGRSARASRRP
jgi:hypothetical protein